MSEWKKGKPEMWIVDGVAYKQASVNNTGLADQIVKTRPTKQSPTTKSTCNERGQKLTSSSKDDEKIDSSSTHEI